MGVAVWVTVVDFRVEDLAGLAGLAGLAAAARLAPLAAGLADWRVAERVDDFGIADFLAADCLGLAADFGLPAGLASFLEAGFFAGTFAFVAIFHRLLITPKRLPTRRRSTRRRGPPELRHARQAAI